MRADYSLNGKAFTENKDLKVKYTMELEVEFASEGGQINGRKEDLLAELTTDFTNDWWVNEWVCPPPFARYCKNLKDKKLVIE